MSTRKFYEAGALVESGKTARGTWPIRIITEGKGSSAVYSREMLEAHKDVFANRPMFGNHPKNPDQPWERSPFEIKAKLGPNIEAREVDGKMALFGEAIVDDEVDAFLEKFHDVVQISIFASGESKEIDGEIYAESFDGGDPYTSVDFVVAGGRGGRVERVLENFRALETSEAPADADKNKEKRMDEATKAFLEALISPISAKLAEFEEKLDNAVTLVESVSDSQPERVEAVTAAGELATAVAEAKLGESAVKRVLESVRDGKSVAEAVKHEIDIRDEILKESGSFVEQRGYFGGSADSDEDYVVSGVRL